MTDEKLRELARELIGISVGDRWREDDVVELLRAHFGPSPLTPFGEQLEETNRELQREIDSEVYIPGCFACPVCQFELSVTCLNVAMGVSGTREQDRTPDDKICPNDGSVMVRVKWSERCVQLSDRIGEEIKLRQPSPCGVAGHLAMHWKHSESGVEDGLLDGTCTLCEGAKI